MKPHLVFYRGKWWVAETNSHGIRELYWGETSVADTLEIWARADNVFWRIYE